MTIYQHELSDTSVLNLLMRFWKKVDVTPTCWNWIASKNPKGYGKFGVGGAGRGWTGAHRVSWEIHSGPIPDDKCVLHSCDNPACVNPNHLWLGTIQDNLRDCGDKGRRSGGRLSGELNSHAKLKERDVLEIRRLGNIENLSTGEICSIFNYVQRQQIRRVLRGGAWTHLPL